MVYSVHRLCSSSFFVACAAHRPHWAEGMNRHTISKSLQVNAQYIPVPVWKDWRNQVLHQVLCDDNTSTK